MDGNYRSDRTNSNGSWRSYLLLSALLIAFFAALSWSVDHRSTIGRLVFLSVLLVVGFVGRHLFIVPRPASTSAGAIVMACGIFINGAIVRFPFLDRRLAVGLSLILLALWALIACEYLRSLLDGTLVERHLSDPVGVFAVGTWVAGTSMCGLTLAHRLPDWLPFVRVLLGLNILLWGFYLVQAFKNFVVLLRAKGWRTVHGVLLLSTVSTQSIVILSVTVWGNASLLGNGARIVIALGAVLYVAALTMIGFRYLSDLRSVDISRDWTSTNCIIHGAMSITGLACCVTDVVPVRLVLVIWLWVLLWFVIVEVIEVLRTIARTRRMGIIRAVWVYSPTQWARNFTFGMLYAFTLNFHLESTLTGGSLTLLESIRSAVLLCGAWVVLALLVYETLLALSSSYSIRRSAR